MANATTKAKTTAAKRILNPKRVASGHGRRINSMSKESRLMKSGNGQYVGITKDIMRQAGAFPGMWYRISVVGRHEIIIRFIEQPEAQPLSLSDVLDEAKRKGISPRDIMAEDRAVGREIL